MQAMLLDCMPTHFASECDRLRSNTPANWGELVAILNDVDKANAGKDKEEQQGRVYTAQGNLSASSSSATSTRAEIQSMMARQENRMTALYTQDYNNQYLRGNQTSGSGTQDCFDCGRTGHVQEDCGARKRARPVGGPNKDKICYRCNKQYKQGHIEADCWDMHGKPEWGHEPKKFRGNNNKGNKGGKKGGKGGKLGSTQSEGSGVATSPTSGGVIPSIDSLFVYDVSGNTNSSSTNLNSSPTTIGNKNNYVSDV